MDTQRVGTSREDVREAGLPVPQPAVRAGKRPSRPAPERDPAYEHLSLAGLRAYRRTLSEEENRVSYWRRILQARLDLVRAGLDGSSTRALDTDALAPVLTEARVGAGRRVLVDVLPAQDMPPLPQLEQLWQRHADPRDPAAVADLARCLAHAERQLSDYRSALHRRISGATDELIARYRASPSLCLSALPVEPVRCSPS
jgi:hypothetical protein